jgi:hypothetical protein
MSPTSTARIVASLGGGNPITIARANSAGITRAEIRAALHARTIERVRHGVVCAVDMQAADPRELVLHRAHALLARVDSDIVVSHSSAAVLHGLAAPPHSDDLVIHLTSLRQRRLRLPGAVIHAARGDVADHITVIEGIPVVAHLRTAIDLARGLPLRSALIPLDAAVRRCVLEDPRTHIYPYDDERVECTEVVAEVLRGVREQVRGLKYCTGIDSLRRAAQETHPASESPLESASRGSFIDAGVIPQALQYRYLDGDGSARRADFLLEAGLIGEADGMVKYSGDLGQERLRDEKLRDLAAAEVGLHTLRWSAHDVWQRQDSWIRHIRREVYQRRHF